MEYILHSTIKEKKAGVLEGIEDAEKLAPSDVAGVMGSFQNDERMSTLSRVCFSVLLLGKFL